jgi:hypothetical protein
LVDYFFCVDCKKPVDEFEEQYELFGKDEIRKCIKCRVVETIGAKYFDKYFNEKENRRKTKN